ncbi:putative E3 ubiquitin-protein ligase ARI8 [Sesamum angolense]|uniref:RBR-type E3 ubiquitin transferase n=1 Tax=Sesamum angolense TaxID=2727404 RepID=A0AAE2BZZ8_9LAMI|nr:putative E3 ubiquitin-protein ligase ARI8 [Sesamum angolense]
MDSEDDDLYYGSGDDEEVEDGGEEEEEPDIASPVSCNLQKQYTILAEEAIKQFQENDISEVSNILSDSRALACTLLSRYNWDISFVFDEWFGNEEKVRDSTGISPKQKSVESAVYCKICLETVENNENVYTASCGHRFCADCWKSYVAVSINDGPGCVTMRCPEPKCKAVVGLDMVELVASEVDKQKYYQFLLRSYVDSKRNLKWCPAPGCELAIQFDAGDSNNYDVACDCGYKFCWNCTQESHRPVECETVDKWIKQNNSEAENTTWIMAFTKQCPKCHRNIEKNQGCNHMTCGRPCSFEFCWLCLEDWRAHTSRVCNTYKEEEEKSKEATRVHLDRYAHYYERWASNHKSWQTALADLEWLRNERIKKLANVQAEPEALLQFVLDAWIQIAECRLILKWTYAYGYYMPPEKSDKVRFFEYLQSEAETALERLHHCAEKEMDKYLNAGKPLEDFKDFRSKLAGLTNVTRNYFENLVRALENNLSEVEECVDYEKRNLPGSLDILTLST